MARRAIFDAYFSLHEITHVEKLPIQQEGDHLLRLHSTRAIGAARDSTNRTKTERYFAGLGLQAAMSEQGVGVVGHGTGEHGATVVGNGSGDLGSSLASTRCMRGARRSVLLHTSVAISPVRRSPISSGVTEGGTMCAPAGSAGHGTDTPSAAVGSIEFERTNVA